MTKKWFVMPVHLYVRATVDLRAAVFVRNFYEPSCRIFSTSSVQRLFLIVCDLENARLLVVEGEREG